MDTTGIRSSLTLPIVVAALLAALIGLLAGTGAVEAHMAVIFIIALSVAYFLGRGARTSEEPWLPGLMVLAMLSKLLGSWVRHYVLFDVYSGSGDARRYHGFGTVIAETWRNFQIPDVSTVGFGSEGTRFTAWVTGLVYAPYEPSLLGGFFLFAILAFVGQFFFYLAFRTIATGKQIRRYAILVFFWPTLVYWPSSIGKEALIMPFLGLGSWAAARLYKSYHIRWLPLIAFGAFTVSMVRVHVAALFAGSLVAGVLLAKRHSRGGEVAARRALVLLIGAVASVPLAIGVGDKFGVDLGSNLSVDDLEPVFDDVGDTTGQGGSQVSGGAIRTPLDIPAGALKVLFRPLPVEANNLQMLASSVEGVLLLGLVLWRSPKIIANRRLIRRSSYLMFCLVYSALFIWAWSAILNLGILARQRALVIPFILALIVALGWDREEDGAELTHAGERVAIDPNTHSQSGRVA